MAGSNDDATASAFHRDSNLCGRCGGQTDIDYVEAHAHECAANNVLDHRAGDACVATNNDFVALHSRCTTNECSISRCELHDVEGIERIACPSSDGASDTRDGFDKCHGYLLFYYFTFSTFQFLLRFSSLYVGPIFLIPLDA